MFFFKWRRVGASAREGGAQLPKQPSPAHLEQLAWAKAARAKVVVERREAKDIQRDAHGGLVHVNNGFAPPHARGNVVAQLGGDLGVGWASRWVGGCVRA